MDTEMFYRIKDERKVDEGENYFIGFMRRKGLFSRTKHQDPFPSQLRGRNQREEKAMEKVGADQKFWPKIELECPLMPR